LQTDTLKENADYLAPDGSEIRLLPTMRGGGFCHCTLPAGKTSSPVTHRHVEEIWYVLRRAGEVWCNGKKAFRKMVCIICRNIDHPSSWREYYANKKL
jgi:mannose-6-phosphate isomerase-like protein (cupin superfamily)